jgi:hypothetical protein
MLVLQSRTDCLQVMAGSSTDTIPTSSGSTYGVGHMEVEENVDVIEGADIGMKQEEIPEDVPFPGIKSEPDEVSYVCVCLLLDKFYHCPEMSVVFVTVFMVSCNSSTICKEIGWVGFLFLVGVDGSVCTKLVGLHVIVEKVKIYSYIHVEKIPYQQDIS